MCRVAPRGVPTRLPAPLAVFGRDRRCDVFVDGAMTGSVTADELLKHVAQLISSRGASR